mgnify:CR=1 FL=1
MLDAVVETIHLFKFVIGVCVSSSGSGAFCVSRLRIQLVMLGLHLVQKLLTAGLIEVKMDLLDLISEASGIFNQFHVFLHNVKVVLTVKSSHLLQLV